MFNGYVSPVSEYGSGAALLSMARNLMIDNFAACIVCRATYAAAVRDLGPDLEKALMLFSAMLSLNLLALMPLMSTLRL